jgi:hypothetical protein
MYPPPPPPPRPPRPPNPLNFISAGRIFDTPPGTGFLTTPPGTPPSGTAPPPPPPNTAGVYPSANLIAPPGTDGPGEGGSGSVGGGQFAPLEPPPLPPLFPYLSMELAQSLEQSASQCGQSFEKEASDLPFVPVIINDDDLKKMTEQVKTQTEESKGMDRLLYKDIIDPNMPKALREMFQPLYCKLCKLTVSVV